MTQMSAAVIVNMDTGKEYPCHFNPNTYTLDKKNTWKTENKTGGNVPKVTFESGSPATLTMELLFDTYADAKPGQKPEDVRVKYTDNIAKLMIVDPKLAPKKSKKGRPPRVKFVWGKTWSFEGVITSLNQKFTLFWPENGVPVRATVQITFQQSKDESTIPKQNPTSAGMGGERLWTVTQGDTLGLIAHKEYGDTAMWRLIAEANHLSDVRYLVPGTTLVIPND